MNLFLDEDECSLHATLPCNKSGNSVLSLFAAHDGSGLGTHNTSKIGNGGVWLAHGNIITAKQNGTFYCWQDAA